MWIKFQEFKNIQLLLSKLKMAERGPIILGLKYIHHSVSGVQLAFTFPQED